MDILGSIAERLFWDLKLFIDWALRNWPVTMIALALLIYWVGGQRRVNRHHS